MPYTKSPKAYLLAITLCLFLSSCSDSISQIQPSSSSASSTDVLQTLNEQMLEVDKLSPGFGGMFYDQDGFLNTYMLSSTKASVDKSALASAISTVFSSQVFSEGLLQSSPNIALKLDDLSTMKVLSGNYRWSDLYKWDKELSSLFYIPEVTFIDIDEEVNKIVVGLTDLSVKSKAQKIVEESGVPAEAVNFIQEDKPKAGRQLTDRVRPIYGGLRVLYNDSFCTLGVNAVRNGVRGFLTNSHCSSEQFKTDNTYYYQGTGTTASNVYIGKEKYDPGYFTNTTRSDCDPGFACRYSDATFVAYDKPSFSTLPPMGYVYKTALNTDPPNLTITGSFKINREVAGTPLTGSILAKIGARTGYTKGGVTRTCYRSTYDKRSYDRKPVYLFCTHKVAANFYYGDSGSAVFTLAEGSNPPVRNIHGLAWGFGGDFGKGTRYFLYSDLNGIRHEMGNIGVVK